MRRIAISMAALTAMGLLATAAQAEVLAGNSTTNGGLVWKFGGHQELRDSRFGYWTAAPAPAAVMVAPKHKRHHR